MKILLHAGTSAAEDTTRVQSPIKICMHVRGVARTDVRVMREATTLVEAGFAVSIVDFESDRTRPVEEDISGIHVKHMIKPDWFISARFKPWFFVKAAQKLIGSTLELIWTPADIYHAHDQTALPACYIAAHWHRKPLIFDAHELPLSELEGTYWYRLHNLLAYFLVAVVSRCAGVITVSPPIAREMSTRYHASDVSLIRNIPPYRSIAKSERLRQCLGLGPEVRIALYQGNLQPNRGLDSLIQAASFLERDIVIVLMGKGIGATQAELEALIASEGVLDRVKLLPPVPYAELLDWTASADIGLIVNPPSYSPNVQMCLPNKLFEYLMAGLPVLASPLEAVTDILRTYEVGRVVSSLAPAHIAVAINTMLADRAALARMHHNALDAAQNDLCWEKEHQQLIRLYRSVLEVQNA